MFAAIGRFSVRYRWWVIGCWLALLLLTLPILPQIEEPLNVGGFSSTETEASRTRDLLVEQLGAAPSTLVIIFQSRDGQLAADSPVFQAQMTEALVDLRTRPKVRDVLLPVDDPALISADRTTAYALVGIAEGAEEAQRDVEELKATIRQPADLTVLITGGPAFYADIETVSQRDLRRAELIAFPFALVTLLVVFGSAVAAVVPLVVGGLGVAGVLLTIWLIAQATELSIFALNLATMLGLGLAVDYSLFLTTRFREELGRTPEDLAGAIERTVALAGRAVFFSAMTVLIGLSGLVLFSFMFLRSVGVAGVVVVTLSSLAALTLLPAVLAVIGKSLHRGQLPLLPRLARHGGGNDWWGALARRVMARPILVLIPTLGLLLLLGTPFLRVEISSPDATILPKGVPSRAAFDLLQEKYGPGEISPFVIAVQSPTSIGVPANLGALYDLTAALQDDPRVQRVQGLTTITAPGSREEAIAGAGAVLRAGELGLDDRIDRLANASTTMVVVYSHYLANDDRSKDLLADLRRWQLGGDLTMSVSGGTAEIVDVVDQMYGDFPVAVLLIVIATYVVLLMLFRSVLLPLKAIVMNTLSILASYGALVWIFQDGHLHRWLRFEPLGFVEASLPVIMFCVLFGLSMDYEIFLLSRVREEWERTGNNVQSVALGLQRSGRIITSAALIVVVVTLSFVSADVILVKALGLGIALAVLLDATVVRALLVPATMRLLGDWNWWIPAWLDRVLPGKGLRED